MQAIYGSGPARSATARFSDDNSNCRTDSVVAAFMSCTDVSLSFRTVKNDMVEKSARILLVDDEQSIQTLLSYPLRKDGYEVVRAADGREALDRFAEQAFDLVVLDLMLPQLDGLEVCRRLRARSAVPI